jgi:hypothetical protein
MIGMRPVHQLTGCLIQRIDVAIVVLAVLAVGGRRSAVGDAEASSSPRLGESGCNRAASPRALGTERRLSELGRECCVLAIRFW